MFDDVPARPAHVRQAIDTTRKGLKDGAVYFDACTTVVDYAARMLGDHFHRLTLQRKRRARVASSNTAGSDAHRPHPESHP